MRKISDIEAHAINRTLVTIAIVLCVLLATGCTSSKQVSRWLQEKPKEQTEPVVKAYLSLNELFAAIFCADEFPVAESEVIKGEEQVKEETTEAEPVIIPCEDEKGHPVKEVKCPPAKVTVRTIYRTDTIRVRDRAQERAWQLENVETQKALTKETEAHTATQEKLENRNTLLLIIIGVVVALLIGLKFLLRR